MSAPSLRPPLSPWDLHLVLQKPSYEPIWDIPFGDLTSKRSFLVTITSVRCVYELAALSCKELFLNLNRNKMDPALLPNLNGILPASKHLCLDVIRAVRVT